MVRRRGDYFELTDEPQVTEAKDRTSPPCDSTFSTEPSQQLVGFIVKPSWWKQSRRSKDVDKSSSDEPRIGISDRPKSEQIVGPRGRSRKPRHVSASSSSRRSPSFLSRRTSRSSRRAAKMLTINENEEFDIGRYSC